MYFAAAEAPLGNWDVFAIDDVVRELKAEIPGLGVDPRVSWAFSGSTQDQQEDMQFLERAMLMALAIMAVILVTQFNSIYQAFLILTAVLFSTGGVLLGHLIMAKPFGVIMSSVGVITLAGIVVNNNIVFIDTYNVLRSRGDSPATRIIDHGNNDRRTVADGFRREHGSDRPRGVDRSPEFPVVDSAGLLCRRRPRFRNATDVAADAEPADGPGQRNSPMEGSSRRPGS